MVKKTMSKKQVIAEKEGILAIAIALISAGMVMIQACVSTQDWIRLVGGIVLLVAGIAILAGRGEMKWNRWHEAPNLWRGQNHNGIVKK